MVSIAVCDDENTVTGQIKQYVYESSAIIAYADSFSLAAFSSGAELCAALDAGKYFDLIYMDIEMDNLDGITTGKLLRERYAHDSTLLIYVSSHTEYHGQLFDVQPFQFIQKPIDKGEFERKLRQALKRINSGSEVFTAKQNRDYFYIKKKDIISLESSRHNIILSRYGAENIVYRGVFKDEAMKLGNTFFIRPHTAFIVNMNHVQSFHGTHMIMDNGSLVPVSRQRAREVKNAFLNYGRITNER